MADKSVDSKIANQHGEVVDNGVDQGVEWLGAVEIARKVNAGELDPQAVVRAHLARISRFNPRLNAYVDVDEAALAGEHGALAGVSVGAKESYQVKGMSWTWSSPKYRGQRAHLDSRPITQFREAGAAILGKTNIPELVASVGTVSPIFGPTHNPWRQGVTPGGSSGGSAAAVAAGLATIATADDLGGSIRMPASCCGVVGLRPSPDRVPHDHPDPTTFDSRGCITRNVADARLVLSVLSGEPASQRASHGLRILAVTETPIGMAPGPAQAVRRAAEALARSGHSVERLDWDPMPIAHSYKVVRRVSLAAWPGDPDEYGPVKALLREGRAISATEYWESLQQGLEVARRIRTRLESGWDAILTPTLGLLPMPHDDVPAFLGEAWNQHVQFVLPISYSWLPSISIPAGLVDGLPVGVMLAGHYRREMDLLNIAEELEAAPGFGFLHPADFN